ncbi:hypothetical protein PG5_23260 [Pseudomonas sp. G5(2012)]|nr:hypothetical protein PG5_23260 [Pseudomonas sp. G5(2012)]
MGLRHGQGSRSITSTSCHDQRLPPTRCVQSRSFPRSAWECSPGRSASQSGRGASVEAFPRGAWE